HAEDTLNDAGDDDSAAADAWIGRAGRGHVEFTNGTPAAWTATLRMVHQLGAVENAIDQADGGIEQADGALLGRQLEVQMVCALLRVAICDEDEVRPTAHKR